MSPAPVPSSLMFISLLLIAATIFFPSCSSHPNPSRIPDGLLIDLTHVDSNGNFTAFQRLQRAVKRSNHRLSTLQSKTTQQQDVIQSPIHAGNGEFLMNLSIGSPPSPLSAIIDTGSDLVWTQCQPCTHCSNQLTNIFDPSKSCSFKKIPCSSHLCHSLPSSTCNHDCEYYYSYGDYSFTQGILAFETFTFGKIKISKIGFGCGEDNEGTGFTQVGGLLGLGRGPLSLISQLGLHGFSYCLTPIDEDKTSKFIFGTSRHVNTNSPSLSFSSTPLVKNPSQPTFYYLSLEGITVGRNKLSIPKSVFALKKDGNGGMIIDSGTTITYLEAAGYRKLKRAFAAQVNLSVVEGSALGLDLCFPLPSSESGVKLPKLVFHFEGADLHLPFKNYMIGDESNGLLCLAIMGSRGLSILGNFQQQNMQIVYNLGKETLLFAHTQCDKI